MPVDYEALANQLEMTEIVRLQDVLSKALVRRFEKRLALVFSDVVGSTTYFARHGDEAGRKLQQRHLDLLGQLLPALHGRVVDTAGDGAFLCFPDIDGAANFSIGLQRLVARDNDERPDEHHLALRIGAHAGPVLSDGRQVAGDAVNVCARIASSASPGEIRLSAQAFSEMRDVRARLQGRRLKAVSLKGIEQPVDLYALDWVDEAIFPARVRFDSGEEVVLPAGRLIRFGRLREQDGQPANEVVLSAPDPASTNRISRWHFELARKSTGLTLRSVSNALTEVDGKAVARGEEVPVKPGSKVRVGGVLTLMFVSAAVASHEETMLPR